MTKPENAKMQHQNLINDEVPRIYNKNTLQFNGEGFIV